jgi:GH43 family beta-xylosidase
MKLEITAMGSVRPVMMVERQECRNRKTIATVSSAPSMSVWRRPSSEPLTQSLLAKMVTQFHVGRQLVLRMSSIAAFTASPVGRCWRPAA